MAKAPTEALTGQQFVGIRTALGLTQPQMAELLGVSMRTVVRMEADEDQAKYVPLNHAKHVRCICREKGIPVPKHRG